MNRQVGLVIGCAALGLLFFGPAICRADFELDHTSQRLAYCGDVYSYAAQRFLLQNNPGAARTMILQFSRATVGLFSLHYKEGSIAGERVAAFKAEGRKTFPGLASVRSCHDN